MAKHLKLCIELSVSAVILLVVSCLFNGIPQIPGILQGIATGLIFGVVLFLVGGIKKKEEKETKAIVSAYDELIFHINNITDILEKTSEAFTQDVVSSWFDENYKGIESFLRRYNKLDMALTGLEAYKYNEYIDQECYPKLDNLKGFLKNWLLRTKNQAVQKAIIYDKEFKGDDINAAIEIISNNMDCKSLYKFLNDLFTISEFTLQIGIFENTLRYKRFEKWDLLKRIDDSII